jgi:hypothetical protein
MYTACVLNENVLLYHLPDTVRLCLCIQHVILMKMFFIITYQKMCALCLCIQHVFLMKMLSLIRYCALVFMYTACDLNENVFHYHLSDNVLCVYVYSM